MRRRGLMFFDALMGLALLAALATALAVGMGMRHKSALMLANQRAAANAAQEALLNLQTTGEASVNDESADVSVHRTGQRVGEREWVEISVVRERRRASIVGLAPTTRPSAQPATQPATAPSNP